MPLKAWRALFARPKPDTEVAAMPAPQKSYTDAVLQKRGAQSYDEMSRDPDAASAIKIKSHAILGAGWIINAADDSEEAAERAVFVRGVLENLSVSLDSVIEALIRSMIIYGTGVGELIWAARDGKWIVADIRPVNPLDCALDYDDGGNPVGLSLGGKSYGFDKFIILRNNPRFGEFWGESDLRAGYMYYWAKRKLMEWYIIYCEKYAMPPLMGTVPIGAGKEAKQALADSLERLKRESVIVAEQGVDVKAIEIPANADFQSAIEFCGRQIVKSILGSTLLSEEGHRSGSYALGNVHLEVFTAQIAKLRRQVEESVDKQLIAPLISYNFANGAAPNFSIIGESKSLKDLADAVYKLVTCQVIDPNESWLREYLGLPDREDVAEEEVGEIGID